MEINIGDLFWLDLGEGIIHPHVVINNNINHGEEDFTVVVCALTTNQKKVNMPGNVVLDVGEGNLSKQSIVEVYKEYKVKKSMLTQYIGSLNNNRIDEILTGIKFIKKSFLQPNNRVLI